MRSLLLSARFLALALAVVAIGAGCGGDDEDGAFQEEVVAARNAADSAFAYIKRPKSTEDLIDRLRLSRDRLKNVSSSVSAAEAPDGLSDEQRRLATALGEMSKEMGAAANSIELILDGPNGAPGPVETLVFDTWDTVQAALTALRNQGIEVLPLRPGGGP